MTFMEIGGNAKAMEYFTKHGLTAPFDYKSPVVDKYKKEQTKKVETILGSGTSSSNERVEKPVFQRVEETIVTAPEPVIQKPVEAKIDKEQTKTKGFSVEFTKNKSNTTNSRNRIAAKKIQNIDLDSLSLQEDQDFKSDNLFPSMNSLNSIDNSIAKSQNEINEDAGRQRQPSPVRVVENKVSDQERFQSFKNAKSISSDSFRGKDSETERADVQRFNGASAISSSQYFGTKEKDSVIDVQQTMENAKEFLTNVGDKLKEKAGSLGGVWNKLNAKWQERNTVTEGN